MAANQIRAAKFLAKTFEFGCRRFHQWRQRARIGLAPKCSPAKAPCPWRERAKPAQWDVQRAVEREKLTPESKQQLPRWQRLYEFARDMPDVAEAGTARARVGPIEQCNLMPFLRQCKSDGATDHAGTDDRNLLFHSDIVYDLR